MDRALLVKHRILLVDDDPFVVEASQILLGLEGHECRVATNGPQAIEEARAFDPDIVILDIGLPGMTGYDVARALRASAGSRPLHLAAVTGHDDVTDIEQARNAGFDQHLVKPVDAAVLSEIVRTAERARIEP
jgi:CheY-like chemotaxis protein